LAAAVLERFGQLPYRNFVYDKPVGTVWFSWAASLAGGASGIGLRLVGAALAAACCATAYRLASTWWSSREGWVAAGLMAVGLTFYVPAAVIPVAPDLAMILPHLLAIHFARTATGRFARAGLGGLFAGLAIWTNSKGVLVALACGLWSPAAAALGLAIGATQLLIPGVWDQVWAWGAVYSADPFVANPLREGMVRTLNWAGFHATAVIGAALFFVLRSPGSRGDKWRAAGWVVLSLIGVLAGARFFPRYYFQLLPVAVVLGARGMMLLPRVATRVALGLLLLVPVVRFGPRYVELALHGDAGWADTALNRDSRAVSARIRSLSRPGDTILVWGYRPDILVYCEMPLGAPFLDSQPLTGVLADRHLTSTKVSYSELAPRNRAQLSRTAPTWVVDGLGPINPALAIESYRDLANWRSGYREVFRTAATVVYRLR
jgi:hypothetical protein